ncbi:MAG: hypothetical protein WCS90_03905 [Bacilli bacterium]
MDQAHFKFESIQVSADLVKIPVIPTLDFKHRALAARLEKKIRKITLG